MMDGCYIDEMISELQIARAYENPIPHALLRLRKSAEQQGLRPDDSIIVAQRRSDHGLILRLAVNIPADIQAKWKQRDWVIRTWDEFITQAI